VPRPSQAVPRPSQAVPRPSQAVPRPSQAVPRPSQAVPRPSQAGGLATEHFLPVQESLAGLFPGGGLRRGSTVLVNTGAVPGTTSFALALLSGPTAAGSWCAVLGVPELGLVAASQLEVDLARLALVPRPGSKWAAATAALFDGFDLVMVHPSEPTRPADAHKLGARARERGPVLVVLEGSWPAPADIRLEVTGCRWQGLCRGNGYLAGCRLEVVASGKGAAVRPRRAELFLGPRAPRPSGSGPGLAAIDLGIATAGRGSAV
jgi:hypothetical protein